MNRSPNVTEKGGRACAAHGEGAGTFDRTFKGAVIIYAVVEFFAIALLLYYKLAR